MTYIKSDIYNKLYIYCPCIELVLCVLKFSVELQQYFSYNVVVSFNDEGWSKAECNENDEPAQDTEEPYRIKLNIFFVKQSVVEIWKK